LVTDLRQTGEDELVFVASLGETPLDGGQGPDLGFALEYVGGTPEPIAWEDTHNFAYSLLGRGIKSPTQMPQAHSAISGQQATGRLRGALARGQLNGWYDPQGYTPLSEGDLDLVHIVGQVSDDWPLPATPGQRAAYDFILTQMSDAQGCKVNYSPMRDLRDNYMFTNRVQTINSCLNGNNPPVYVPDKGFGSNDYNDMLAQLQKEAEYVHGSVETFHDSFARGIKSGEVTAGFKIGKLVDQFSDDPKVKDGTAQVLLIIGDIVKGIGAVAGAAEIPGAGTVAGVINAALNVAAKLSRNTAGGSLDFEHTVCEIRQDQDDIANQFLDIINGLDHQVALLKTDWGKLDMFRDKWANTWAFTDETFDIDVPKQLSNAYQRHVAERLTAQIFVAMQRGMTGVAQWHAWGRDYRNQGEGINANFDASWDPVTLQTNRYDSRKDVILIKKQPFLTHNRADPNQWKSDRPFLPTGNPDSPGVLGFLTDELGIYKPDIYRRWNLPWIRCDYVSDEVIDTKEWRPRDCQLTCEQDRVLGESACLRKLGGD